MRRKWLAIAGAGLLFFALWVLYSPFPNPVERPLSGQPDAILILGGGDLARVRVAAKLAQDFPNLPILISGDEGYLETNLRAYPIDPSRILIEPSAESTWENASFSGPILRDLDANRVILVTNWYHVKRAGAVFRKVLPDLHFDLKFESGPATMSIGDRHTVRREKIASLFYFFRYVVAGK